MVLQALVLECANRDLAGIVDQNVYIAKRSIVSAMNRCAHRTPTQHGAQPRSP